MDMQGEELQQEMDMKLGRLPLYENMSCWWSVDTSMEKLHLATTCMTLPGFPLSSASAHCCQIQGQT